MNTIGTDAARVPLPVGQCLPSLTLIGQQKRLEQRRRPPLAAALGPGGLASTRCAVSPASPQGGPYRKPIGFLTGPVDRCGDRPRRGARQDVAALRLGRRHA